MAEGALVETRKDGAAGLITLRNERALNALTFEMILVIEEALHRWAIDDDVGCVVIEGAGERAFCAGGDVRAVALAGRSADWRLTRDFFWREYRLNSAIAHYAKPWVALIDGITMGGGVGLSAHGAVQVATERTLWAMPETAIGFFPDVGASHVLNGLEAPVAAFLALTGWRLGAGDLVALGLATHFIPHDRLSEAKAALAGGEARAALDALAKPAPPASIADLLPTVRNCFTESSVEGILFSLRRDGSPFALKAAGMLERMSPTSCKVTLEQLRRTRGLGLDDCLRLEFRMSQHFMAGHDFYEGIRALLIDKDQKPSWQPATLPEVTPELVEAHFAPLPADELEFEAEVVGAYGRA